MIKITREQANAIIEEESIKAHYLDIACPEKAVICYRGQWYDVRGKSEKEIETFIMSLLQTNPLFKGQVI